MSTLAIIVTFQAARGLVETIRTMKVVDENLADLSSYAKRVAVILEDVMDTLGEKPCPPELERSLEGIQEAILLASQFVFDYGRMGKLARVRFPRNVF